jgi:alanine racemase
MPRPLVVIIDIAAMRANLATARSHAPQAKVWAVVKANAYGHGLINSVRAYTAADGLALVETEGAARLREMGWQKPILLLEGVFEAADWHTVLEHRLESVVHCNEQIAMLEQARLEAPVKVHLKVNTGMNRLGFKPEAVRDAYARLCAIEAVRGIGFVTHFANADDASNPRLPLAEQVRRFTRATAGLEGPVSLANSAVTLLEPELALDWIRPGIMLYGGSPGGASAAEYGLVPAMTLESRIIAVQDVPAGEAVGYGSRYLAGQGMRVGVVACGYADGYPRHAPNGTPVLVDGVRTGIVGRVSMDMLAVDLGPVPAARPGSRVTLWGGALPIDEVAAAAGTIGYELMCAVAPRVRMEVVD